MNGTGNNEDIGAKSVPTAITYFIRVGEAIKIGFASNLKDRLSSLQTSHPEKLEVVAAIAARLLSEREAQEKFAHLRIRGEWFRAEDELLEFIEKAKERYGEAVPYEPPSQRNKIAEDVRITGYLKQIRDKHGAHTPAGHRCSNLMEMILNYRASKDQAQRAALAQNMKREMATLAKFEASAA